MFIDALHEKKDATVTCLSAMRSFGLSDLRKTNVFHLSTAHDDGFCFPL